MMKYQDYSYENLVKFENYITDSPKTILARKIYNSYIIEDAISILGEKIDNLLKINNKNNKDIITVKSNRYKFSFDILQKQTIKNLIRCSPTTYLFDRNLIIRRLKLILQAGGDFYIHKIDIESFYESFDKNLIIENIVKIKELSPVSKNLLSNIISFSPSGLPRGLAISSTLSDILMNEFDRNIMLNDNIFFYSRFVDDIIIISSKNFKTINLIDILLKELPNLKLNKSKSLTLHHSKKNNESLEFNYLGYLFKKKPIENGGSKLIIDISDNKIKKIKTRIVKSLLDYNKSKDKDLLIQRIKFLSCSYKLYIIRDGRHINSGIRFNYPEITDTTPNSLKNIDQFFKSLILGKNKRIGMIVNDKKLKNTLLSMSFLKFYKNKTFFKFSINEINKIKECWKNE